MNNALNFPAAFISRIQTQLASEGNAFLASLEADPPVSIRINPEKKILAGDEKIPWCSTGFYLTKRPSFTLDPLFHAGCYYVQDASSMFLEQVFQQLGLTEKKLLVLDACAAPGGKSTHLASLMSKDSMLVSNEVIGSRIPPLRENLVKWGSPNLLITNNDPSAFTPFENLFDVILVDAPCSGEGLFRKDHDALEQWSELNCEINAARQQRILTSLLPALKPGGLLIYSTCTFNPKENEENVKWLLEYEKMDCQEFETKEDWGIKNIKDKNCNAYAFLPHRTKGEGLFISVLRKKEENFAPLKLKVKSKAFGAPAGKFSHINSWINNENGNFSIVQKDNLVFIQHKDWLPEIEFISQHARAVHSGTCMAELKGDKAIPAHELAMSILLKKNIFPQVEVDAADALHYLRKEEFKTGPLEKGYALITHQGYPLGFINFIGTRFNNYYPHAWRIRMK